MPGYSARARNAVRKRYPPRPRRAASALFTLGLLATALVGCGGSTNLAGSYETTIPGHTEFLSGRWGLTLNKNGTLSSGGGVSLSIGGPSHWHGDELVIATAQPGSCGLPNGVGSYKLHLTGKTLRLRVVKDPCRLRVVILSYPYTKVA
jgi:hypothetical protein